MGLLDQLNELYEVARDSVADVVDTPGTYETELVSVKFDGENKWKDGTLVPRVRCTFKVVEGEQEGNLLFVDLNLNGRTENDRNISLRVFAQTSRKLGVEDKTLNITETIKALGECVGAKATVVAKQNGEYINSSVK